MSDIGAVPIGAGDRVTCQTPDPGSRLAKGRIYTVGQASTHGRERWLTLKELPGVMWAASRFAKAPAYMYGWPRGTP